jgi:NAD(P)H-dependent FMN reductase
MKVFAISGSPREKSFTEKMLNSFIQGLGRGVQLVKFYPHKMNINHCLGCWDCWTKTKGVCQQKDEMARILPEVESADIILLAAPLYVDGFPSHVKKVFDRMLPIVKGKMFVDWEGRSRHVRRHSKDQRAILISSCGFPEIDNFKPMKVHFKAICKNAGWIPSGEIRITTSGAAHSPRILKKLDTIKQAGKEFAKLSRIPLELEHKIAKEVMSRIVYRSMVNAHFEGPFSGAKEFFSEIFLRKAKKRQLEHKSR